MLELCWKCFYGGLHMDTKLEPNFVCILNSNISTYSNGRVNKVCLGGWGEGEPSISVGKFSETSYGKKLRKVLEKQS
jgi:hypothetical protein